jgi:putative redox protein
MAALTIAYKGGMRFDATARQHTVAIDLSPEKGGTDSGMNPPETFMASLGACVGVYVAHYGRAAKLDMEGMKIDMDWQLSEDKTKIARIQISIALPQAEVGKRQKAVLDVAHHCLIHNTIFGQPDVTMTLVTP